MTTKVLFAQHVSQGWELHGAADSLEEISPNILSSKEFKVTYNGKEITS